MGLRILVVGDSVEVENLFNLQFRKELKNGKIEFLFSFTAQEALDHLKNDEKVSAVLVFSIINMPGMSGIDLLKEIKNQDSSLPVFMVTGHMDENYRKIAQQYGANEFILKPVDFGELKEKIFVL